MPIADKKKAAAAVFIYGIQGEIVEQALQEMERALGLYESQSVVGDRTYLEANANAVKGKINALRAQMDSAIWSDLRTEAVRLKSHGAAAIEVDA